MFTESVLSGVSGAILKAAGRQVVDECIQHGKPARFGLGWHQHEISYTKLIKWK